MKRGLILFSFVIFIYSCLNTFIHELGHFLIGKFFGIEGYIEIHKLFGFTLKESEFNGIFKITDWNYSNLEEWKLILVYSGGIIFEILFFIVLISGILYFSRKNRNKEFLFFKNSSIIFLCLSLSSSFYFNIIDDRVNDGRLIKEIMIEKENSQK